MPLERLRSLPLTPEARLVLLAELRDEAESPGTAVALQLELAEVTLRCCQDAIEQRAWPGALEHHDQLLDLVAPLAKVLPEQAEAIWSGYGELLGALAAAVHGAVNSQSQEPPPLLRRAELCWQLAERLHLGRQLPFAAPDWLAVIEQQLVQDGAAYWTELISAPSPPPVEPDQARQRAFVLLMRLSRLLVPAPEWVLLQARVYLVALADALLAQDHPDPAALAQLCRMVESLPLEPERQPALRAALTRARLGLELLAPELGPLESGAAAAATAAPVTSAEAPLAELVWLPDDRQASPLQLNLAPLLAQEEAGDPLPALEEALDDFIWNLPRGSRAQPAATTLLAALEPAWRGGLRLPAAAFERLAYLAGVWQRRFREKLEPLPALDWQHSLLIELDDTELAVLQPLLASPAALEPVLATLRMEHHNPAFWQERQELSWMQCPPPLEALRRLHVEQGYFARPHEPLQSLIEWGTHGVQALLEGQLWTDDAGCLGRWLALAQELVAHGPEPLPPLGAPPSAERLLAELGGLEVVYAGEQAAAVQAAHQAGRCFRGAPFGLRVLEAPASRWPARPAGSFEESLAVLLEAVDGLYRQRPFAVLLADCGAYRLPLLHQVHQRYGVAALSSGRPLAGWLGG